MEPKRSNHFLAHLPTILLLVLFAMSYGCQLCPMDLIVGRPPGADRRIVTSDPAIQAV